MKTNSYVPVFFFCLLLHIFPTAKSQKPLAPALYAFGDSLLDAGNNNYLPTSAKANFLPYGINFPNGPTGRFTNGKTSADILAEYLGLPFPPAYLSLSEDQKMATKTGMNYASGSSGILAGTGKIMGDNLELDKQMELFQDTVKNYLPKQFSNVQQLSQYLSKSIFMISAGSNDFILNFSSQYTRNGISVPKVTPEAFSEKLKVTLSEHLQRLYELGARKFIISEVGPLGCIPAVIKTVKPIGSSGSCTEDINEWANIFNQKVGALVKELSANLPGSMFVNMRVNSLALNIHDKPAVYGIREVSEPCCAGALNGILLCPPLSPACLLPQTHYFFDPVHPSQTVNTVIIRQCFNGSTICLPNVQQLLQA
ncbi:PREDICTED: GDSL esterase/lipase 7-like [Nelumbo nucifera]|uniref:GDSL esterase/lipase 7-like n=2 Tax=Nelumbo nucifera TaxID=4432 RepID=A0A1U7ZU48_NELNU|nr:PREDICTED: GDSL esterase/lipase 7-like [Nelumbo nucifera]DAD31558.1 TPA_asm: hypothetical protein HUJ06_010409 [Nelumbo nucifera]